MTTRAISTLTLDGTLRFPAHSLLSLASQTVRLLHAHFTQQHQISLSAGDEASENESVENLTDVEITLQELDPVYWKELADKRLHAAGKSSYNKYRATLLYSKLNVYLTRSLMLCVVGGFTSWTATELARRAEPEARMSVLLELSRIPKAFWVVPQAVKLWRESQGARVNGTENQESEDAQLDFLIFLSEKRERAELFKLVTADDNAYT